MVEHQQAVQVEVEVAIKQVVMPMMENLQILDKDMATKSVQKC
jgi:hypothetical protein